MRDDLPSQTAAWVAQWRGLAPWLPDGAQLASDPFGLSFSPTMGRPLVQLASLSPSLLRRMLSRGPLARMVLWLQLRTRGLDDFLLAFLRAGGRQLVLLGAGFDCRASRFAGELTGATVFEIDHPATQGRKRSVLAQLAAPSARTEYLAWNFERDAMDTLGARLRSLGHDPTQPTFTIWEGVTPYLTEPAIVSTVNAVRDWSAASGSQLALTYITPTALAKVGSFRHVVSLLGEPFRFGWEPPDLPEWMAAHRMRLVSDESDVDLARRLLPPHLASRLGDPGRHVALASPM